MEDQYRPVTSPRASADATAKNGQILPAAEVRLNKRADGKFDAAEFDPPEAVPEPALKAKHVIPVPPPQPSPPHTRGATMGT